MLKQVHKKVNPKETEPSGSDHDKIATTSDNVREILISCLHLRRRQFYSAEHEIMDLDKKCNLKLFTLRPIA